MHRRWSSLGFFDVGGSLLAFSLEGLLLGYKQAEDA